MSAVLPGIGSGMLPVGAIVTNSTGTIPHACSSILDEAYRLLSDGRVEAGMEFLMGRLSELRKDCGPEEWDEIFHAELMNHPVGPLIWQDPFTDHSFRKPRGYPGDALLLDYIYGYLPPP